MKLIGTKNNWDIYSNLLGNLIPNDIELYVEPFGGEFGLYEIMPMKPTIAIYNDIDTDLYNRIKIKYQNIKSISCFNKDYKDIINEFDSKNTFIYLDPPYFLKKYYRYNLEKKDHIELANILKNMKSNFLLSYQDRPLMRKLYKGYDIYKYAGTNYFLKPEIAITNY